MAGSTVEGSCRSVHKVWNPVFVSYPIGDAVRGLKRFRRIFFSERLTNEPDSHAGLILLIIVPFANGNAQTGHLDDVAKQCDITIMRNQPDIGCAIDKKRFAEHTALHLAAYRNHPEIVRLLIEAGADVNARILSIIGENSLGFGIGDTDSTVWHRVSYPGNFSTTIPILAFGG